MIGKRKVRSSFPNGIIVDDTKITDILIRKKLNDFLDHIGPKMVSKICQ